MTYIITLNRDELEVAAEVGIRRQLNSGRRNCRDDSFGWRTDIEAACAELAVAKRFGCYWSGAMDGVRCPDVAGCQVRHTPHEQGKLIVRPKDSDLDRFVLVTGTSPTFTLRGWMWAEHAKVDAFECDPGDRGARCWMVPRDKLQNMSTLELHPWDLHA